MLAAKKGGWGRLLSRSMFADDIPLATLAETSAVEPAPFLCRAFKQSLRHAATQISRQIAASERAKQLIG